MMDALILAKQVVNEIVEGIAIMGARIPVLEVALEVLDKQR